MPRNPPRPMPRATGTAPRVLSLDDLGAKGRPLHVLNLQTFEPNADRNVAVATCYLLLFVTRGKGKGRHLEQLQLARGDVHLIPAGSRLELLEAGDLAGWLVAFDPTALQLFDGLAGETQSGAAPITHLIPSQSLLVRGLTSLRPERKRWARMLALVSELERELASTDWGTLPAGQALLILLVIELQRHLQRHAPRAPLTASPMVRDALAFLERHCREAITVDEVAHAVHRSPGYLSRAVRKETGLTLGEWLREHRMVEARRRLLGSSQSVERIATEVGYGDVTHFIRTFRKVHGVTPRAWRAKQEPPRTGRTRSGAD